jgi:hypothetical protein
MPLVEMPKDCAPLFGSGAQVMIGGPLVHQLREWKKRKREGIGNAKGPEVDEGPDRP